MKQTRMRSVNISGKIYELTILKHSITTIMYGARLTMENKICKQETRMEDRHLAFHKALLRSS